MESFIGPILIYSTLPALFLIVASVFGAKTREEVDQQSFKPEYVTENEQKRQWLWVNTIVTVLVVVVLGVGFLFVAAGGIGLD